MFSEIGSFCATLALILAFSAWILHMENVSRKYWIAHQTALFILLIISFLCLISAFAISDFSMLLVVNNSSELKPLIYKISAAWGNHEGSLLMWICSLSFFGLVMSLAKTNQVRLQGTALAIQSTLVFIFICFMIAKSNPFIQIFPAPIRGLGLNPILQDIGLAFHPPVLYLGYVGLSIAFSYALSYAITRANFTDAAKLMRPFVLLSMGFLTLGITLGSWWAYRELGWGGYWFWDAVENASLLSWLAGCALLHSITLKSDDYLHVRLGYWLSVAGFLLSVTGTFLVRSGIITSVHSFAVDPERGIFIFAMLIFFTSVSIAAAIYSKTAEKVTRFKLLSKPCFVFLNNFIMIFFILVILVGTFYPLLLEFVKNYKVSVGPPYYLAFFKWCVAGLLIGCIIQTIYKSNMRPIELMKSAFLLFLLSIAVVISMYVICGLSLASTILLIFAIALFCSLLKNIYEKGVSKLFKPHILGHLGFAVLSIAIAINASLQKDKEEVIQLKDKVVVSGFSASLDKIDIKMGANYVSRQATFELTRGESWIGRATPEISYYPIEMQQTSESGIYKTPFYDLYLTISPSESPEELIVRFGFKPMMNFIWLGGFMIALAFFLSSFQTIKRW